MQKPTKKLLDYLNLERKSLLIIYLYAILSGLVNLTVPLGIQAIVSYAMGATMVTSVYILIGFVTLGTWLAGYFQVRVMQIIETLQQKIFVRYSVLFAEKIPRLDISKINQYYLPELVNRFFDTQNLQKGISKLLLVLPLALIQIIFGLILLSFYHPYFIGFSIIVLIAIVFIFWVTSNRGITTSLEESDSKYEVASWLEDMAREVRSFKDNVFVRSGVEETDSKLITYLKHRTAHFKILLFQYKSIIFFKVVITLFMLLLGTYLLINQKISIGAFVATEIVVITIMSAVEKLVKSLEVYYDIITSFVKLDKVLQLQEETGGTLVLENHQDGLDLEAKDVYFGFDPQAPIIADLTAAFQKNRIHLITGPQGSGKSVLLNLLAGFYQPSSGSILLAGQPLYTYDTTNLRQQIGIYMDDLDVVKGNVLQNINLGDAQITPERISSFAARLGVPAFAALFQDGLLTRVQASDNRIPYTSKKLILLLRVLLGDKRLLLLENPVEGFNTDVQEHILTYLRELSAHKTIIITGPATVYASIADQMLQLEDGRLTTTRI